MMGALRIVLLQRLGPELLWESRVSTAEVRGWSSLTIHIIAATVGLYLVLRPEDGLRLATKLSKKKWNHYFANPDEERLELLRTIINFRIYGLFVFAIGLMYFAWT